MGPNDRPQPFAFTKDEFNHLTDCLNRTGDAVRQKVILEGVDDLASQLTVEGESARLLVKQIKETIAACSRGTIKHKECCSKISPRAVSLASAIERNRPS